MKSPALLALALASAALAADPRGDHPDAKPSTPQEQLKMFHLPPGFEIQLVAAEPEIQKPINLTFDAAGRLWVSGSEMYPWPAGTDAQGKPIPNFAKAYDDIAGAFGARGKAPAPSNQARDSVRVLSDFDETGHARKITVFADGLNIPSGVQPLPRGSAAIAKIFPDAYIPDPNPAVRKPAPVGQGHLRDVPKGDSAIIYSIPNIYLMTDWDGDGRADKREILYGTAGFLDTHGGMSSFLYWIDGWIYGTHGFRNHSEIRDKTGRLTVLDSGNTYRFRPDGSAFEIYTHGQTNPFGLTVDPLGNFYSADSHSKPVYMLLRGAYYEGIGKQHDGLGFAPRITDDDHGSTAIAGIAYYAAEQFPEEYRGNLFNGNPVTQRLNRDKLEWHGSTPRAIRQPDFLTCDDPWFRPVQVKLGPDGALYIADFYNPIIGHYEFPLADPRRDHTHGRIWRIVWRGESARAQNASPAPIPASAPSAPENPAPALAKGSAGFQPAPAGILPAGTDASPAKNAPSTSDAPLHVPGRMPATAGRMPALPDLTALDAAGLVEKLADPNLIVRTLATNELVDTGGNRSPHRLFSQNGYTIESLRRLYRHPEEETEAEFKPDSATARAHALWVRERLQRQRISDISVARDAREPSDAQVRIFAMRILAERKRLEGPAYGELVMGLQDGDAMVRRTAGEALAKIEFRLESHSSARLVFTPRAHPLWDDPRTTPVLHLLRAWKAAPADDLELIHQIKVTLKSLMGSRANDGMYVANFDATADAKGADLLAEVCLAIPTPEAAEFLLRHLSRTEFQGPRSSELLRHTLLYRSVQNLELLTNGLVERFKDAPLPQRLSVADNVAAAYRQRGLPLPDAITAWTQRTMVDALATTDEALLKRAIESVRETKLDAKYEPLDLIIKDPKRTGPIRAAALEAVANLDLGPATLSGALADASSMTLRKRAAELLGQMTGNKNAQLTLLAALPTAPAELATAIAAGLAKTDDTGALLLTAIEQGKAAPALLLEKLVATAIEKRAQPLRDRAAALTKDLPPEDARLDGVIAKRVEAFRAAQPDATHGAQVFAQQCAVCHRLQNTGGSIGPALDGVGARGLHRLTEDILDPNRNVDPIFRQTVIETTDGQTLAGVNAREEGELLTLTDATGKPVSVAKAKVKSQTQSRLSLMPAAFEQTIPANDFNDLLAHLLGTAPK